ncbi:MAG: sigma-70 family RNA polymerase sigma factor [Paenibacillus lautus]|uniref:sigma-70 family RNA polymerase sigma factor n=1 Tax=Paenibacillus lautus TaxID=1401 RepID=UPI0026F2792A|nr:sigma-70 family RNA polymerase sigma factor [Paenibacillus lautus]MCI1777164.1 sigma-70 family RNA polymerase sigma factor [Paenibacillus lautus]
MNIGYNPHLGYEADIVKNYENLVHKVAKRYRVALNAGLDYEDLVSVGTMGLIEAFRKYDPSRFNGAVNSFITLAYPAIQGRIQNFLRDKRYLVKIPRTLQSKANMIRREGWGDDRPETIAEKTGWKLADVRSALELLDGWSPSSLDRPMAVTYKGDEEITMLDIIPSNTDFSDIYIQEFMSLLDPRERKLLRLRLQDQTQRQIAQAIGISQVQAGRILKQIGIKFIQYQAGTLKQEDTQMGRGRSNMGGNIEWFVDEGVSTTPTIGLNGHGIHLNKRAVHEMGCKAGQCLQVGYDPEGNRLVMQVANKGLQLRTQSGDNGGLRLINKRLSAWLNQKKVTTKRYALQVDTERDLFYIQLESHA